MIPWLNGSCVMAGRYRVFSFFSWIHKDVWVWALPSALFSCRLYDLLRLRDIESYSTFEQGAGGETVTLYDLWLMLRTI